MARVRIPYEHGLLADFLRDNVPGVPDCLPYEVSIGRSRLEEFVGRNYETSYSARWFDGTVVRGRLEMSWGRSRFTVLSITLSRSFNANDNPDASGLTDWQKAVALGTVGGPENSHITASRGDRGRLVLTASMKIPRAA